MEIISEKQSAGDFIPPRKTAIMEMLLKTNPDHHLAQKYREEEKAYKKRLQEHLDKIPKPEVRSLPALEPIDIEDFYATTFKSAFRFFRGKDFDENANDSEARKFARTVAAYLIGKKSFVKSPLLHQKSVPSINKGMMVIGDYGIGKTSILQTFHEMLKYANNNPITVKDINGTDQFLGRYGLGFGYHTANEVVKNYETIGTNKENQHQEKNIFWKRMTTGTKYFDDIMTENQASNYGKIEIFKNIFEERYVTGAKTIISLNYVGDTVDSTLDAFGNRYGERVYDRLFEMFNIVELRGRSLRN